MRCPLRCCPCPTQLKALKRQRAELQARIQELQDRAARAGLRSAGLESWAQAFVPSLQPEELRESLAGGMGLCGSCTSHVQRGSMATQTRSAAMAHFKQQLLELKVCGMVVATMLKLAVQGGALTARGGAQGLMLMLMLTPCSV